MVRDQTNFDLVGRPTEAYGPYVGPVVDPDVATPPGAGTTQSYALGGLAVSDPLGRVHQVIAPDGQVATTHHEGRTTRSLDADQNETISIVDFMGNEIRRELYDGTSLAMQYDHTYDGLGRLVTTMVDADPATTITHHYDTLGNLIRIDDPDSGTWRFAYDARGNRIYEDSAVPGAHVQSTYDELGRRRLRCTYRKDAFVATSESDCGSGGTQESPPTRTTRRRAGTWASGDSRASSISPAARRRTSTRAAAWCVRRRSSRASRRSSNTRTTHRTAC